MLRKLSRLTYANVMSTIAVFGVLAGGTAYAANTVFSSDIVDGEVKSVDIADESIKSGDITDNTVNTFDVHSFLGVDVVDNTLTGADIDESTLVGVPDNVTVRSQVISVFLAAGQTSGALVQSCDAGEVVIQGGGGETNPDTRIDVTLSRARLNDAIPTEWEIQLRNNGSFVNVSFNARVSAVCLKT